MLREGFPLEVRDGLLTCLGYAGIGAMPPIPEGVEAIGDDAFAGRRLARLTLPATLRRIGRRAFQKCVLPREIVLPNRLEVIDVEAFYGCQSLESIRFENGLRAIQARAFWYCIALRCVALPASLRLVGSRAFEGCDRLRHVEIHCPGAEFDEYVFNETPYWHRLLEIAELASPRRLGLTPECPETLMLPEGHTHIDLYAFARSRIKYARLPGSLRTMGMCAFRDCKQLEEVSLSANTYCKGRETARSEQRIADGSPQAAEAAAKEWQRIAAQVQTDLETHSREWSDRAGGMALNLREGRRSRLRFSDFLRRFGVLTEVPAADLDSWDNMLYSYGIHSPRSGIGLRFVSQPYPPFGLISGFCS